MRRAILPTRYWALLATGLFATAAIAGVHCWEGVVRPAPASYPMCLTCSEQAHDFKWAAPGGFKPGVPPGFAEKTSLESKGERCEIGWSYLGKRGAADWYQLTVSRPLQSGAEETFTREFAYKGRPLVVFRTNGASVVATPDFSLAGAASGAVRSAQVP